MNTRPARRKTSFGALIVLVALMCGVTAYIISELQTSNNTYQTVQIELSKPAYSGNLKTVEFPGYDTPINIPSWQLFDQGELWTLVSAKQPLANGFTPLGLTNLTLPHGDMDQPMKIQPRIAEPLKQLFSAAEKSGRPLMISSAYRSIEEQRALYNDFVNVQGQSAADRYVADPGTSEHHTGLSVDLSTASDFCTLDSDNCALSLDDGRWLAENAYRFGFILRYPEGKQPITGIAYEPWHYRYVGIPLAAALHGSGLTLDEALVQMRPAFAK